MPKLLAAAMILAAASEVWSSADAVVAAFAPTPIETEAKSGAASSVALPVR